MKFYSEFIVFHEDISMPNEKMFCPLLWNSEQFESDGDFYYDNINGRWTQLVLESTEAKEENSKLYIDVFRMFDQNYDPHLEGEKLARFIKYKENGEYDHVENIKSIQKPAIASFQFETFKQNHYKDFLETVHFFLEYSKGCLVNYIHHDSEKFKKDFLK